MTDKATDKKAESFAAAKNLNKHLTDLFNEMQRKDAVLASQANELAYVARQLGDIRVMIYAGSQAQAVVLRTYLESIVASLNGARS